MHIVRRQETESPFFNEAGERIFELFAADNHSMIRLELEPGAVSPAIPHFHKRAEETYVVLSGDAEITINNEIIPLSAGDIAVAGVGEKHQIKAVGSTPLVAFAIMAPGFDPDDVFE